MTEDKKVQGTQSPRESQSFQTVGYETRNWEFDFLIVKPPMPLKAPLILTAYRLLEVTRAADVRTEVILFFSSDGKTETREVAHVTYKVTGEHVELSSIAFDTSDSVHPLDDTAAEQLANLLAEDATSIMWHCRARSPLTLDGPLPSSRAADVEDNDGMLHCLRYNEKEILDVELLEYIAEESPEHPRTAARSRAMDDAVLALQEMEVYGSKLARNALDGLALARLAHEVS